MKLLWLVCVLLELAMARAGGGGGYSGGGSSSSSGSSSYSSGGSYSSGSSYSGGGSSYYDRDSSYRRGYYGDDDYYYRRRRYYGPGVFETILMNYSGWAGRNPIRGTIATLSLAGFMIWGLSLGNRARQDRVIGSGLALERETRRAADLTALRARDPAFDSAAFVVKAQGIFREVQAAWSAMDMSIARSSISDGVMERFTLQLEQLRAAGTRNEVADIHFSGTELLGYEGTDAWDILHVRFPVTCQDRDVSLADGKVLRGGPSHFEEAWSFARPRAGGRDWTLCEITQVSEWSVRDAMKAAPGLAAAVDRDPGLCAQGLEDRASVAFWRWQEAMQMRKVDALRSVASDECCSALARSLAADASYYRDASVGAAITLAVEPRERFDLAHVVIRWSGDRCLSETRQGKAFMETVLTLMRHSGAVTDAEGGLRSLRCPSCAAVPLARSAPACLSCGQKFNDGSREWTLVGVTPAIEWKMPVIKPSSAGFTPARSAGVTVKAVAAPEPAAPVALVVSSGASEHDWAAALSPDAALRVLAVSMSADGRIGEEERRYLADFGRKRGIPDGAVAELLAAAEQGRAQLPIPVSPAEADSFLRGVVTMALADGRIEPDERRAIAACARAAAMSDKQVDDLIESERKALYARALAAFDKPRA